MSSDAGRPRLSIPVQQPWFAILSRAQRILVGFAVGAFIFLSGGVLDWFVTRHYLPRASLMLAGAVVALAVGILVFLILTDIQRRYQAMDGRLRRIAELNHHIRNALQVIAYHNVPERGERAIQQVNAELLRIQSVLRAVSTALGEDADLPAGIISKQRRQR
jgi:predicted PurR-regulated permease PerM